MNAIAFLPEHAASSCSEEDLLKACVASETRAFDLLERGAEVATIHLGSCTISLIQDPMSDMRELIIQASSGDHMVIPADILMRLV